MKITARTLFFIVAVVLDFIELISCKVPVAGTLAQIFPGYHGALPPFRIFTHDEARAYEDLEKIGDNLIMRRPIHCPLVAIGHVVIGFVGSDSMLKAQKGDYIEPLWKLFRGLSDQNRLVFNTADESWVNLPQDEFNQLGFGRIWKIVRARQSVAAFTRGNAGSQLVNDYAHQHAYIVANHAAAELETTETARIARGVTTISDSCGLITRTYEQIYNTEFNNRAASKRFGWKN